MKDLWSVIRIALSVMALPLMAAAAVSALNNVDSVPNVSEDVVALRAASASTQESSFRNHLVAIDSDGVVRGRVARIASGGTSGLADMKVFFIQSGAVVAQVYSHSDGTFEATGISPGNYSFVTSGSQGFAAFGVRATSMANPMTNNLIEVGTASPTYDRMREIIDPQMPMDSLEISPVPDSMAPVGANQVRIINGNINGNLINLLGRVEDGRVHLVQNNTVVANALTDENGRFVFNNVEPGIYEFVGTARSGFAITAFEALLGEPVITAQNNSDDSDSVFRFVSSSKVVSEELQDAPSQVVSFANSTIEPAAYQDQLEVALVQPGDSNVVYEMVGPVEESYVETYMGDDLVYGTAQGGYGGGYGGGGGFGGGGGGFGGGFAGLGRAAVLGWILTELFDNIDFSRGPIPPASPATN